MSTSFPYQQLEQSIIQIITSDLDVNTMLTDIAEELGKSFSVDICLIIPSLIETNKKNNIYLWPVEARFNLDSISNLHINEITNLGLLAINNLQDTEFNKAFKNLGLSALLINNISFSANISGVIILGKYDSYNWNKNEIVLIKNISSLLSLALRLYQLQEQAKLTNKYETIFREISGTLLQTSSINSLLKLALEAIVKAIQVSHGLIITLKYANPLFKRLGHKVKPQGKAEVVYRSKNSQDEDEHEDENEKNYSCKLSESLLILEALKQAPQPLAIDNVNDFSDLLEINPPIIFNPQTMASLLFIPIMGSMTSESKTPIILGLILLQDTKLHCWSEQELQLVNWVSIQLSINILHNQSLSRVQELVEERTSQLKWSLDVQAKLSEKMRKQLEELQQLNKLKDDFLSSMSHELNTPLTTMKMAIKMLREAECSPERQAKYLDILEQEWNREYNLIKDLLTLQQVESNKLSIQPQQISLNEIVDKLSEVFIEKWSATKGLSLVINYDYGTRRNQVLSSDFQVYSDPYTLEQIITELLLNAGKYAEPDTEVQLNISRKITIQGYQIILSITNYGWGISEEEKKYVFDKFRRGKGVTDSAIPGTGLGLTMVKSLVEHLDGTIEVSSEPTENLPTYVTSFTVTLPQLIQ